MNRLYVTVALLLSGLISLAGCSGECATPATTRSIFRRLAFRQQLRTPKRLWRSTSSVRLPTFAVEPLCSICPRNRLVSTSVNAGLSILATS